MSSTSPLGARAPSQRARAAMVTGPTSCQEGGATPRGASSPARASSPAASRRAARRSRRGGRG